MPRFDKSKVQILNVNRSFVTMETIQQYLKIDKLKKHYHYIEKKEDTKINGV